MTFTSRVIRVTFQLGKGTFGESGQYDTVEFTGLRTIVTISKVNGHAMGTANLRVYGLTREHMAALSSLNRGTMLARKNVLTIAAGDAGTPVQNIFIGEVSLGQIDMQGTPDSALEVLAYSSLYNAIKPAAPSSYPGVSVDAGTILADLARKMGYQFENHLKAPVPLSTPYFPGTLRDQAQRCVDAAHINWVIDNNILAIWDKDGSRGGTLPRIAPDTGMVGYPRYVAGIGIGVKLMFNPFLQLGQSVIVDSDLLFARGQWNVFNISHNLDSETPDGEWFTSFEGSPFNTAAVSNG